MTIQSIEELRHWQQQQPKEFSAAIAVRSALRALPALTSHSGFSSLATSKQKNQFVLLSLRALITTIFAAENSAGKLGNAAFMAFAIRAANTTDAAAHAAYSIRSARLADAVNASIFASIAIGVQAETFTFADCNLDHSEIFSSKLWHASSAPSHLKKITDNDSILNEGHHWSFWQEWYDGFLAGEPLDWELQRRVALIPNKEWKKGPVHIAKKIEEVRKAFDLYTALQELKDQLITLASTPAYTPQGHNGGRHDLATPRRNFTR